MPAYDTLHHRFLQVFVFKTQAEPAGIAPTMRERELGPDRMFKASSCATLTTFQVPQQAQAQLGDAVAAKRGRLAKAANNKRFMFNRLSRVQCKTKICPMGLNCP